MADDTFSPDIFPSGCLVTGDGSDQSHREVLYANRYVCELTGLTREALTGKPFATLFTNASNIMVDSYVMPMLLHEERCEEILLELKASDGERVPVLLNAVRQESDSAVIQWSLFRAVHRNRLYQELLDARHQLEEKARKLSELSITDELTGLLNRRELKRRTDMLLAQAERTGQPVSLLVLDLDDFKQLNDSLGHLEGDRVLASLGKILRTEGRESDIIARYGGDEFVIVMPDTSATAANSLAKRLAAKVGEIDAGDQRFSATFGVSCSISGEPLSLDDMFLKADRELYEAKAARNVRD